MSSSVQVSPDLAGAALILVRDMMCVVEHEHVLVTCDTNTEKLAVDAIVSAAYALGAKIASMTLSPPLPFQGGLANPYLPDPVVAAAQNCDAWIDCLQKSLEILRRHFLSQYKRKSKFKRSISRFFYPYITK